MRHLIQNKIAELIRKHTSPGIIQNLCQKRLNLFAGEAREQGFAPCIDFPYHLARGLGASADKAEAVSVLSTLIYLGCDLLDDFHDNDLPQDTEEYSAPQVTLASSIFLSVLPTLAASQYLVSADAMEACRLIAEALAVMAAGQSRDVQSRFNPKLSVEEIEDNIRAKSGEELALFGRLSALVSDKNQADSLARFGAHTATALQIASDLTDLFSAPASKDLKEGVFTIPLALHWLRLPEKEKPFFLRVWRESALNPATRQVLCNFLRESGAAAHTAFMIETFLHRGEKELSSLPLQGDSLHGLQALIEKISDYALSYLRSYLHLPEKEKTPQSVFLAM